MRSSCAGSSPLSPTPTNTWRMTGLRRRASRPILSGSTGTSRQPSNSRPSSAMTPSISELTFPAASGCGGRKTMPTPYSPGDGSWKPSRSLSRRKRASGICSSMPAPSPVSGSLPAAPRWPRLMSTWSPSSIIWWDLRPLMSATTPTPQLSCSCSGEYRPFRDNSFSGSISLRYPARETCEAEFQCGLRAVCNRQWLGGHSLPSRCAA